MAHRMACDGVHGQQRHGIHGVWPQGVAGPRTLQDARFGHVSQAAQLPPAAGCLRAAEVYKLYKRGGAR